MLEAVRAWEEAYLLEPSNLRAREFLRSALERIHAHMGPAGKLQKGAPQAGHPWLPSEPPLVSPDEPISKTERFPNPPRPPPPPREALEEAQSLVKESLRNPWDEGPSLAIPQPEDPGDETSGAWSIHKEPLPMQAVADDETEVWMRGARELLALNDFSGALELLGKLLEKKPNDKEAEKLHQTCEHNLTLMYESKIGSMSGKPRIAIKPDEIIWLNLDPRAGFVLAQIDGEVSFEDLYAICGLKRLDTARILSELLEQGVVQVAGRQAPVAKRAARRT